MSDLENQLARLDIGQGSVAAVGTFDGVHLGHRKLLETVRDTAKSKGLESIAITFRVQPRAVIQPDLPASYLATLEQRTGLLESLGIDHVVPVNFDDPLRSLTAGEFLEMLVQTAKLHGLVLGPGARMGHDRQDATALKSLAAERGIEVYEVQPAEVDGKRVSSSAIRASLAAGDVDSARAMLGRPYSLSGVVIHGDKRGRELGFPTANIEPTAGLVVPANGIYATLFEADGSRRMAATSIGVRPTFGGGDRLVEAFVIDFDGDLYGDQVNLEFVKRLRGELKFDGVQPLIDQMNRDVEETRSVLSSTI